MAKLNGVTTVSGGVIEYGGARYKEAEDGARVGDIIMSVLEGYDFCPYGAFFDVVDKNGEVAYVDENDKSLTFAPYETDFNVFRRVESTLKVGDYARVLIGNRCDEIVSGDIVTITEVDAEDDDLPYRAALVTRDCYEEWIESAERITPAEARAALIAQIDALIPSP